MARSRDGRDGLDRQYGDTRQLAARGGLHARYAPTPWFPWVRERLGLSGGMRVLDAGCGPAWMWRAWAGTLPPGLRLTLLDRSETMASEAGRNAAAAGLEAEAVVGDASSLPFEEGAFDLVMQLHVLYHVPDPGAALDEAVRVLRPGGRIAVATNMPAAFSELQSIAAEALGGSADDPGAAIFSLDDAERALRARCTHVERFDLRDGYEGIAPEDALGFLLSISPGFQADEDGRAALAEAVRRAADRAGGTLRATRHTGMVIGRTG